MSPIMINPLYILFGAFLSSIFLLGFFPQKNQFAGGLPGGADQRLQKEVEKAEPPCDIIQTISFEGESFAVGSNIYSQTGTYLDTLTGWQGGDSVIVSHVTIVPAVQAAGQPIIICPGDSAHLTSVNSQFYSWSPGQSLNDSTIFNPVAFPGQTTTYEVTGSSITENLVVNGDFEQGDTGFLSDYNSAGSTLQSGTYAVVSNPQLSHPSFPVCQDHTTGSGNMMVANGATDPGLFVWRQTMSVQPGEQYFFCLWMCNISDIQFLPQLQLIINGNPVGPVFSPVPVLCEWSKFSVTWDAGPASGADIGIINLNLAGGGNDLAIDDIFFSRLCISTDTVTVIVNEVAPLQVDAVICNGATYQLPGGTIVSTPGMFTDTLSTEFGCDSVVATNLTVLPNPQFIQNLVLCEGNTLIIDGNEYDQPGLYADTLAASNGCDSLIVTFLSFSPPPLTTQSLSICSGESITVGNEVYDQPGMYQDTLQTPAGCDSIVQTALIVYPAVAFSQSFSLCEGESVSVGNNTYSQTGTYQDSLQTWQGCDSIVTTSLQIFSNETFTQHLLPCEGESVTVGGNAYTQSGNYQDILQTWQGCDSTVFTNLDFSPVFSQTLTETICDGQVFSVGNQTFDQAGVYSIPLQTVAGCDSIFHLNLSVETFSLDIFPEPPSCFGETDGSVSVSTAGSTTGPYLFGLNDTTFLTPDSLFENLAGGDYVLWAENGNGCLKDFSFTLSEPGKLLLTLPDSLEVELGNRVLLVPQVNFVPGSVFWSPASGLDCDTCLQTFAVPFETTTYLLNLQDMNGCIVEGQTTVEVLKPFYVYVPSAFSPNDDGINDLLTVFAGPSVSQVLSFKIFNRWGGQVYEAFHFLPNDPATGWNGKFKGQRVNTGIFVWWAEVEFINGERKIFKGDVTVLQ